MDDKEKRPTYYNKDHQQKYYKKVKKLTVNFNMDKEEDVELLEYLNSQENKSTFVKNLISIHMKK